MKTLPTLFCLLFSALGFPLFGQTAYKDAFELKEIFLQNKAFVNRVPVDKDTPGRRDSAELIRRYIRILSRHTTGMGIQDTLASDLLIRYNGNPFFEKYGLPTEGLSERASGLGFSFDGLSGDAATKSSQLGRSFGGLGVADLADGLAKFLVKRTKEELAAAFFKDLQAALADNPDLQVLFPATTDLLGGIGDQIYHFNPYLKSLREGFISDLRGLPDELETLVALLPEGSVKSKLHIAPEVRIYVQDLFEVIHLLLGKANVRDVLDFLGEEARIQIDSVRPEISGSFRVLMEVSRSIENTRLADRHWISKPDFKVLFRDTIAQDFYLGLVYQRLRMTPIRIGPEGELVRVGDVMDAAKAQAFLHSVDGFLTAGHRTYEIFKGIEDGKFEATDSIAQGKYFDYIRAATELVGVAKNFGAIFFPNDPALREMDKVVRVVGKIGDITLHVRRANYSAAVIHSSLLIGELFDNSDKVTCPLMHFGAFMAAVAECKNSDQVAEVIESFALPVGSSSLKKTSGFNLALGAYTGFNGSLERLTKVSASDRWRGNMALSAPVGVAASWGNPSVKNPSAWTVYCSIIDVGAFTAYRFGNEDNTEELPDLKWSNLFAPGLAVVYGFPKYPLSVGVNAQIGPNLRSITSDGVYEFSRTGGLRAGLSLSVDIPVFSFYSKGGSGGGCGISKLEKPVSK